MALALASVRQSGDEGGGVTVGTDYGRPHGTSAYGAGIERPGDREKDDDRVNDHAKLSQSNVQDMADQARQTVSAAADAVQSTVDQARGHFRSAVDHARDKMTEYREHGWGRVQGDIVEYTRSQPLAALGMAAAIGLLLGWLTLTARRAGSGPDSRLGPVPDPGAADQPADSPGRGAVDRRALLAPQA
jgi:ElaB/YqjD/DUF883 family membrane-anchored ribosome-binding protein